MAALDNDDNKADLSARRHDLERQLIEKGVLQDPQLKQNTHIGQAETEKKQLGQAVKLASEFFAAVVVGVLLGLGFDQITGFSPWGLVVFLFLGFFAGILNMLRAVGYVAPHHIGRAQDDIVSARETRHGLNVKKTNDDIVSAHENRRVECEKDER